MEQTSFHQENFRRRTRYTAVFLILAAVFCVVTVLNINTGNVHIPVPKILRILFLKEGAATEYNIIWKIRLPRILMAALLGGALSLSGFLKYFFIFRKKLLFVNDLENKKFFDLKYNYLEMKSIIEASSKELEHRQDNLDNELTSYHLEDMCSKDEYLLKLNECYKEMNELQVEISSYLQRCEKLVGTTDKEQLFAQINQVKKNYYNKLESISEKIQSETSILIELNGLKEQTIWLNRKQSLELKKANLDYLDKRMEKLEESKNYVEDYIMNKTNEYFNSDIINQIYNKIDPHPMMKHIKFITEKDNDGLKTHIYTYDESETDKMSPVVYLSSAQVNILSLCIFLSKVLSEKNTTFNTIFIDDPIQHLDGINLLSFIDVLRTITTDFERQIVISTHNEQFYKLLKVKMDERYYPSKFIELTSTGKIKW